MFPFLLYFNCCKDTLTSEYPKINCDTGFVCRSGRLNEKSKKSLHKVVSFLSFYSLIAHFVSLIVVTGMITNFSMTSGLFNDIIVMFGGERSSSPQNPRLFRFVDVASGIWKPGFGVLGESGQDGILYIPSIRLNLLARGVFLHRKGKSRRRKRGMSSSSFMNTIRFNFLYIDKYSFGKTWIYPESVIPYNMLRYVIDGSAEFLVDGEPVIVKKGQISYIPEGCHLCCRALEDNFAFYSIRFTTSVFYEGANFLKEYYGFAPVMDGNERMGTYFSDIYRWVRTEAKSKIFHVRGTLELLIGTIIDQLQQNAELYISADVNGLEYNLEQIRNRVQKLKLQIDPRIQAVIDYIMINPMETYPTEKLSQMAEVAPTTFRRLFKEATGNTASEFIRQLRLTTAARILLVSNDPVNSIALQVGFEDTNHFIRVFKQTFGLTPNQYRKISQQ